MVIHKIQADFVLLIRFSHSGCILAIFSTPPSNSHTTLTHHIMSSLLQRINFGLPESLNFG